MLAYLLAHRDRVVPKDELLKQLWPEQFVGDEALKTCLKTLRQALGERARTSRFIHTRHGQGYRFVAPVEVQEHLPADAAPPALAPPPSLPPLPERALREVPLPLAHTLEGEHKQVTVLCGALGDQRRLGQICAVMSHHCWRMGAHDDAIAYGQRALTAAGGDVALQAEANGYLGTFYFSLGDYRRAIDVLRQSMTALEGKLLHRRPGNMIISVRTRYWLADCLGALGEFAEGLACGVEAIRIAEAAGHLYSATLAQARLGQLALRKGDLQHAILMLERALAHCRAADIPLYLDTLMATLGLAYALSGRITEVLPLLEQVVGHEDSGRGGDATMNILGEAYLLAGCLENALQLAERALVLARDRKERGNQAWTLRLLGEIAAHHHPPDTIQAKTSYHQALTLATALGMRPLVAHCHLGLGTLYATTGRREQARAALATALGLYRALEMTFWLPQAEAILAQVA